VLTQALCLPPGPGIGASFVPASTACNAPGATASPCCLADFDKAGGRSIDDIFIYLNAWFASSEFANFAEPGQPNIDDIFVFLNAWFAGCD
jgi:hypothetical protein